MLGELQKLVGGEVSALSNAREIVYENGERRAICDLLRLIFNNEKWIYRTEEIK